MKLIIGLGNDEPKYNQTRHNIGFEMVDHIAEEYDAKWSAKPKLKAHVAECKLGGEKIIIAKPTTMYNLSGEAVQALSSFYKINIENILAIHDELALPFGTIRTRLHGTDAGNNGIKSLNAHIGPDYARIRIGIANDHLSPSNASHFVLQKFNKEEQESINNVAKHVVDFTEHFIHHEKEFSQTTTKF